MGLRRRTYADTSDRQILQSSPEERRRRHDFVTEIFDQLKADRSFGRDVLLNVGAGRAIVPDEAPFFRQFDRVLLVEPDDQRREDLTQHPDAQGAEFLGTPIQELDPAQLPPADFVLCKWVIQHLPTADVEPAVERLKAACVPGGSVGIFSSSSSGEPFFMLSAQPEVRAQLPAHLRPANASYVTKEQFEELIANDLGLQFITTHHLDRSRLVASFDGWDVTTQISSFGAIYLQARKPA